MKKLSLALLVSIGFTGAANAQTPSQLVSVNDGTGYIGVSAAVSSEYLGSADEEIRALPYLSFQNVKGFDLFGTSLRYRLVEVGTGRGLDKWSLTAGPRIAFQGGRDSDDSQTLAGFEDVDASLPLGGYINSTIGPVGLRVEAGQDIIGGHGGLVVDSSIGTFYKTGAFAIQPSATISWANGDHNSSFFGVNAAQSIASGLDAYDAGSGIYGYSANVLSWVELNDRYAVSLFASYRWFTGDAKDSPILLAADGSKNGIFAALSVSRKFDTKQW